MQISRKLLALLFAGAVFAPAANALDSNGRLAVPIENVSRTGEQKSSLAGWKVKEWDGKADVEVVDTDIGKAIHLRSNSTSTALYREMAIDVKRYPMLSWKWKVTRLPKGADVRGKATDDQAAQLYVIFPYKWPAALNSRLIGYIWDTTAPKDAVVTSAKNSNIRYIVLRSGAAGTGKWQEEQRNVYEDYKKLFGDEPPEATALSVMIDSNDTRSNAESFVGDIYLSR